jgi:transposase-like protein
LSVSDYSQSFTEAIKAVYPQARFQADYFHTVKNIWGHLKKSLLSYRRQIKASGAEKKDEQLLASLILDSRVLRDQELNERRKQRFASLADVVHELKET